MSVPQASGHEMGRAPAVSRTALWAGCVLSALPVLMMTFSAVMKFIRHPSVIKGMAQFGYPEKLIVPVGMLEIACVIVYLIPRTSTLGAILVAAYLGGATATMVRLGNPTSFLPVLLGVCAWLGLYLRESRLRPLVPFRR